MVVRSLGAAVGVAGVSSKVAVLEHGRGVPAKPGADALRLQVVRPWNKHSHLYYAAQVRAVVVGVLVVHPLVKSGRIHVDDHAARRLVGVEAVGKVDFRDGGSRFLQPAHDLIGVAAHLFAGGFVVELAYQADGGGGSICADKPLT